MMINKLFEIEQFVHSELSWNHAEKEIAGSRLAYLLNPADLLQIIGMGIFVVAITYIKSMNSICTLFLYILFTNYL